MSNPNDARVDYIVTQTRQIAGQHRKEGEMISMSPAQAKYYLPPYGSGLKLAKPASASGKSKGPERQET